MEEAETPVLDELFRRGASPEVAWSAATWTLPGLVSLFTGASVRAHGWDLPFPRDIGHATYPPLPPLPTLAEVLAASGFATEGVYGNALLGQDVGLDRGFASWEAVPDPLVPEAVAARVAGWDDGRRHFLYVHLLGLHQPLNPSVAARARWGVPQAFPDPRGLFHRPTLARGDRGVEVYRRAYLATVEDTDARLGAILAALGPERERTAIVVTADHGEMLGERGLLGHDGWVWEPLTRVPFAAERTPPLPPLLTTTAVPDLLCRALGVPAEWPDEADPPLVSQREGKVALSQDGRLKGVWDEESFDEGLAVFDLAADPDESAPLPSPPDLEAARFAWERAVPAHSLAAIPGAMPDAQVEALGALGYLDGP